MPSTDGSVYIDIEMNAADAEKELAALKRRIFDLEKNIDLKINLQDSLSQQMAKVGAELDFAKQRLQEMVSASAGTYSNEALKEQEAIVKALQADFDRLARESEKNTTQIERANTELSYMRQRYAAVVEEAAKLANEQDEAAQGTERMAKATKSMNGFQKVQRRISGLFKRVFFFSMITAGLRSIRTWLSNTIKANDEAVAAIAKLKGAFLTMVQPLMSVVIPALVTFVNILTKIVSVVGGMIASLFGKTSKETAEAAEGLYEEQNALEGVGGAAEEAAGSLAGFDEINTIQTENKGGGGGGSPSDASAPDFSEAGDTSWLSDVLGDAAGWVTAALLLGGIALVAIGACTGRLGLVLAGLLLIGTALWIGAETGVLQSWVETLHLNSVQEFVVLALLLAGIAIVAIGAAMGNILMVIAGLALLGTIIVYTEKSGLMKSWSEEQVSQAASYVTAALLLGGIALVAIGAAMGNILMVTAGLALLAAGVYVGIKSETLESWAKKLGLETVFDYVVAATQLAGIALIAIGAAMANIVMVIAGGVLLALGVAAEIIGEETLKSWWEVLKLTSVQQWISVVTLLAGIVLIAIGAAMANILMVLAGMVILAIGTITAHEGNLKDWVEVLGLKKVAGWVTAALLLAGIGLVVFGICTANILLVAAGLGLLGAGIAIGVTTGTFSSWIDSILQGLKDGWQSIKNWWKTHISKYLSWDYWKGLGKDMIDGILDGLAGIFDGLSSWASGVWDSITGFFSGKNAKESVEKSAPKTKSGTVSTYSPTPLPAAPRYSSNPPPTISQDKIPLLAQGAVIPPNREFAAVLGDQTSGYNIEAPEDLIRRIVREESGVGTEEMVALLEEILAATKARQKLYVNRRVLAETARDGINDMTRAAGKPVLLF